MSGLYQITVAEARGYVAVSADIDQLAVVMGCTSAGSGLSSFYLSDTAAHAGVGYGDAVDTLCQIINQAQPDGSAVRRPAAIYTLPVVTPASYGAVDDTGVTGTVEVTMDAAVLPRGTYDAYLRFINGGLIGTTGITFVWSLDGGTNESQVTALSTASSYTIADGNVKFVFSPASADLTALNTLINEIFTDQNEHVVLTSGSVHGAADNDDVVSDSTYPSATNTSTRVARINAMRAAYELHRLKTAGGTHANADTTNVIAAPAAIDDATALALALDLKAKLNAHESSATVHTAADATNQVTSAAPSAGSVVAGDIVRCRTVAPAPDASGVTAACAALAAASLQFGVLVCDFDLTAALAAAISAGLTTLNTAGKRPLCLVRTRLPDYGTSETEAAWFADCASEFAAFSDSRMACAAIYGLLTDSFSTRQYLRSGLAQLAADVVRVPRSQWPDCPSDRKMANFTLVNSSGVTVGHDEGPRGAATGLSNDTLGNRFVCVQRLADASRLEDVFTTVPWVMYAADERIRNIPTRRVCNAIERVAVTAGTSLMGSKVGYMPAVGATSAYLTDGGRRLVHGVIFDALSREFRDDIQNPDAAALDTGLVQVQQNITVSGGNLLAISVTLAPVVWGYLQTLNITLAVQQ